MFKTTLKKFSISFFIFFFSLLSVSNCFGKYAAVRFMYDRNLDFKYDSSVKGQTVLRTIVMWVTSWIYLIAGILDVFVFNVIEFWSDKNPIGFNEYNKQGRFVKTFTHKNESLTLIYSEFGHKLNIRLSNGSETKELVALKSEPGKFFTEVNGELEEMQISSKQIGESLLLQTAKRGKLDSSTVVKVKDLNELEAKITNRL
jgi:hypothetical protein